MRRFAIATSLSFLLSATAGFAQQTPPPGPGAPGTVKICHDKIPPPCADPPHAIKSPEPQYSNEAREKKIQGTVVLRMVVGPDGRARDVHVERSLGYGLDQQAIKAIKKWKFKSATMDGNPVAVEITVQVDFRLY